MEAYDTLSSPEKRREYDESLNLRDIKVEKTYNERIHKNIYYFWWSRVYLYFLPLIFLFLCNLFFHSELSLSLWVFIAYVIFFLLLPWVLLSIFPPFWFVVSSRHTRNMGGLTIMLYIIGMMVGIGGIMSFIFNPKEYQEFLWHLPIRLELVIIFYVVSIIVFFLVAGEVIKIKENVLFYQALTLGLIISAICANFSFKRNDWICFFIFSFYIAVCVDFLISALVHERLRLKFEKEIYNTEIKILLSKE